MLAVAAIANIVKTSLGPVGLDKVRRACMGVMEIVHGVLHGLQRVLHTLRCW